MPTPATIPVSTSTNFLHPAQAFEHPSARCERSRSHAQREAGDPRVLGSDACAVEATPALRRGPNGQHVSFDDVMDALRSLDEEARAADGGAKYKKRLRITEVTDRLARKLRKGDGGYGPIGSPN